MGDTIEDMDIEIEQKNNEKEFSEEKEDYQIVKFLKK